MEKFTFNDETVENSYGFTIPNAGIKLERFNANPIMLDSHWNNTNNVLGNWKNVTLEGTQLKGEPNFDMEDETAKKIAGKVERGFIRGCSMGVTFDREKMKQNPDGKWVLSECELFEVSIVAIPSNSKAVRLFSLEGVEMKEDEVKLAVSELIGESNLSVNKEEQTMEKFNLSATSLVALGLTTQPTDAVELDKHIATLSEKLKAKSDALEATEAKLKAGAESIAKALVEEAKLAGKITGAEVDEYVKSATENYELTAKMFAKIPAKTNLSAKNTGADAGDGLPKNTDDFEKLSAEAKLAFKTDNPDKYKALFTK